MGWMIVGIAALVATNVWIGVRWLNERSAHRATSIRLQTSDWLLDYYREQELARAEQRENDAYLRVAGGCNCEPMCADCGRAVDEHYREENMHFAAEEMQDVYGIASCDRSDRWAGLFPECWADWSKQDSEVNEDLDYEDYAEELRKLRENTQETEEDTLAYIHDGMEDVPSL